MSSPSPSWCAFHLQTFRRAHGCTLQYWISLVGSWYNVTRQLILFRVALALLPRSYLKDSTFLVSGSNLPGSMNQTLETLQPSGRLPLTREETLWYTTSR